MSKHSIIELEPHQRRMNGRTVSERQFERIELNQVAGHSTLVLASSLANAVLLGMELRERKKVRRLVLMIVGGMVVAIGLVQLAIHLMMR